MTGRYEPPDHLKLEAADAQNAEAMRQQQLRAESDFKFIMGSKQGRRFMWRLLGITRLHSTPFAVQRETTDFNCGMQNVGLILQAEMHAKCPERYFEMVKEQQEDERSRTRS